MTIADAIIYKPHPYFFAGMRIDKVHIEIVEPTAQNIENKVCEILKIDAAKLHIKKRSREIVEARQIAMYAMCLLTRMSLKNIGLYFGGFDHTTVIHSKETVKDLMDTDKKYRERVLLILQTFGK